MHGSLVLHRLEHRVDRREAAGQALGPDGLARHHAVSLERGSLARAWARSVAVGF